MTAMTDSEALAVLDHEIARWPNIDQYSDGKKLIAARAHIAEALRDAARYRWLRVNRLPPEGKTQPAAWISGRGNLYIESDWLTEDLADMVIDAAIKDEP